MRNELPKGWRVIEGGEKSEKENQRKQNNVAKKLRQKTKPLIYLIPGVPLLFESLNSHKTKKN